MTVEIVREPLVAFANLVAAQSDLLAALGSTGSGDTLQVNYGEGTPATELPFPALVWKFLSDSGKYDLDDNPTGYRTITLQLDLFGAAEPELLVLGSLVDQMNDAHRPAGDPPNRPLDSLHWKCTLLRRMSDWRKIDWRQRPVETSGMPLLQLSSDWTFKLLRKENVT